jgi:hypothetical protein
MNSLRWLLRKASARPEMVPTAFGVIRNNCKLSGNLTNKQKRTGIVFTLFLKPRCTTLTLSQSITPHVEYSEVTIGELHPPAAQASGETIVADPSCERQDAIVPPTPELDRSPVTPKTPASTFPVTPTSPSFGISGDSPEYPTVAHPEGGIDPTTLFVGGLEMHGPNAWDEERVANLFGRYGGLESVRVVKPSERSLLIPFTFLICVTANGRSAFAFVKFDNTESPARAVEFEVCSVLYP